jgi:hypothetical protein
LGFIPNHRFWKDNLYEHFCNSFLCKQACISFEKKENSIVRFGSSQRYSSRNNREFEMVSQNKAFK